MSGAAPGVGGVGGGGTGGTGPVAFVGQWKAPILIVLFVKGGLRPSASPRRDLYATTDCCGGVLFGMDMLHSLPQAMENLDGGGVYGWYLAEGGVGGAAGGIGRLGDTATTVSRLLMRWRWETFPPFTLLSAWCWEKPPTATATGLSLGGRKSKGIGRGMDGAGGAGEAKGVRGGIEAPLKRPLSGGACERRLCFFIRVLNLFRLLPRPPVRGGE